jgi:hypothetical protein
MKFLSLVFLLFANLILSQNMPDKSIIVNILNESIVPDFHHFLGIKMVDKKNIPSIYFFKKNVELDFNRFEVNNLEKKPNSKKHIYFEEYSVDFTNANFIVFNSHLLGNSIIFEVYYKREEYFNIPNDSEYEFWRRMNGGMSYYFEFDENNNLKGFKKKWFSYD